MSKPLPFYKLYDYQQYAIDAIFQYYNEGGTGKPLVVAPGASGKTVMIAETCRIITTTWKNEKVLVLSDDQEILTQDYDAITKQNPDLTIGLYSASLNSRTIGDITVAAIQTVFNKPELFKDFTFIIVDEAHKIPLNKKSRYLKFLLAMNKPTVGFTATPFRLGTGYIHIGEGAFFSEIVYTITYNELLKAGRVCKLVNKQPGITLDASQIKKQAGDYIIKELSLAFDRSSITDEIVADLLVYKQLRKKWLVFAIDIDHCEHIAEKLNEAGIKTAVVHSKTGVNRSVIISKFKDDHYQAVVSVAMMTTGVNIPEVDLIVLLRSTASPSLHGQIIVRGARVFPGKEDCLILDYAGNLMRNGPIDRPVIVVAGKGNGEPVMKVCENCDEIVHIAVRVCPSCGSQFHFQHSLTLAASQAQIMQAVHWHDVNSVTYDVYTAANGKAMFAIFYQCGIRAFRQLVPIEHGGRATYNAHHWWKRRSDVEPPMTAIECIEQSGTLKVPVEILVDESGKYDDIKEFNF